MTKEEFNKSIVTISKDHLALLSAAEYKGEIEVIDTDEALYDAVNDISKYGVIGFDTETKPSFRKGQQFNVALIQLATPKKAYLFRTNKIGFPQPLVNILQNPNILKVGVSIHDDFHNLKKVTEIDPCGFIDLQSYVKDFKIADNSLSRVYAILFDERISKSQRLTNWEAGDLTMAQKNYAALDAYACLRIYNHLKSGKFNPAESPYLTSPPSPIEQ